MLNGQLDEKRVAGAESVEWVDEEEGLPDELLDEEVDGLTL